MCELRQNDIEQLRSRQEITLRDAKLKAQADGARTTKLLLAAQGQRIIAEPELREEYHRLASFATAEPGWAGIACEVQRIIDSHLALYGVLAALAERSEAR